ncbi:unnamed protein product [Caenorhabditis bovis]|uniref:Acetylcholine receptor-like protein cup-4 n=1 Tax=Caenorhabditis bovis TaxID=2654633 RepID=A0A8S1EVM9_9PELO|nr:unnamed protein product [Caenorhabditis bovis]
MHKRAALLVIFVFFLPPIPKAKAAIDGIDSEVGEAEEFYNRTYSEHHSKLERDLFRKYSTRVRPVKNSSLPTIVDIHWHVVHVSINQNDQTMTMHGHIYMKWTDEFLVWNPADYNGIRTARCKKWQVWQPKIKVANSAAGIYSNFDFSTNAHVLIHMQEKEKAKVEMYPTFSITVGCSFDFKNYPDDENACSVNIFATSPMTEIQLQNYYSIPPSLSFSWNDKVTKRKKTIISDFDILNVTNDLLYYSGGNISSNSPSTIKELVSTWSLLSTTVRFRRHSPLFLAAVGLPSITSIINVMAFLVPSLISASYILMANMFIQVIFLQDMIKKIPLSVSELPNSVRLYSFIMLCNVSSLLINFMFIYLTTNAKFDLPDYLKPVFSLRNVLPASWRQPDEARNNWTEWFRVVRPTICILLGVVYLIQIMVFIIF